MKISFNAKKLYYQIITELSSAIGYLETKVNKNSSDIENLINTPSGASNGWIELIVNANKSAEITQEFSEIRMLGLVGNARDKCYSITCNYDSTIFHNKSSEQDYYFICGNPIQNNYGCKFRYTVNGNNKQIVSLEECFDGGTALYTGVFKVWIKPNNSPQ